MTVVHTKAFMGLGATLRKFFNLPDWIKIHVMQCKIHMLATELNFNLMRHENSTV